MTKIRPLHLAGMPRLHKGASEGPENGACIMQYVSLIRYERFDDAPRCVNIDVRHLAINVNDLSSDEEREDRLMPLVHRLMNTQGLTSAQRKQLKRWRLKAEEEAAEAHHQVNIKWRGERYSTYCGCDLADCRYTPFDKAYDGAAAEVAYKWLLKMLRQIEAWKHTKPAPVTREEWDSWDELRMKYAGVQCETT